MLQNLQENTCARVSFLIKLQQHFFLQNTSGSCFCTHIPTHTHKHYPMLPLINLSGHYIAGTFSFSEPCLSKETKFPYWILVLAKGITPSAAIFIQKHPSRGVFRKRCSENMQQIYSRLHMAKCDFKKVATKILK